MKKKPNPTLSLTGLITGLMILGTFLSYASTAAPSIDQLFSDTLEFQLVGPTFGIAHPTGYPLYTILGGVWSRLIFPFGNWAWRMNLFSALSAAGTVGLVFLIGRRLAQPDLSGATGGPLRQETCQVRPSRNLHPGQNLSGATGGPLRQETCQVRPSRNLHPGQNFVGAPDRSSPNRNGWSAGIIAAFLFFINPLWWSQAIQAEVYALHNFFVAAILLVALLVPDTGLLMLSFLFGLALTHHLTIVLLGPPVLLYLLLTQPHLRRPQRVWLYAIGLFAAPLLLYGWLPVRAWMGVRDLNGAYLNTWTGFWHHILARGYTNYLSQANTEHRPAFDWLWLLLQQLPWSGLLLAGLGFCSIAWRRRDWQAWLLIALTLLSNLSFTVVYKVSDAENYLLPAVLCLALFAALGFASLEEMVTKHAIRSPSTIYILTLLLILLFWLERPIPPINHSQDWQVHDEMVAMAKTDFPPGSRVIGLEGEMTALRYLQQAEGLGLNARPIVADLPADRLRAIHESMAASYPTYLTREVAGIETLYSFSGEGMLVRLWPLGQAQIEPPSHPLAEEFADGALRLVGYDLQPLAQAGGPAWQITLYWQAQRPLAQTLKLSLRWLDAQDQTLPWPNGEIGQDIFPLQQAAQTQDWRVGEVIRDRYLLSQLPGAQRLLVIVYDAQTGVEVGRWQVGFMVVKN